MHTATHRHSKQVVNVCRMVMDFSPYTHEPQPEKEIISVLSSQPTEEKLNEYKKKYGCEIFVENDTIWA